MVSQMHDKLLDVKNLSVDYISENGIVHAVDTVSFTLRRGEVMGLAGESGSGKSTLAYAIARLHQYPAEITQGEVWFHHHDGEPVDILKMTPAELKACRWKQLAVVFQSAMNALNPVIRLEEQIYDALRAHQTGLGKDALRKRALELLALVGIASDRLRSYPHELSGGMKQRAMIAIAMALNPDIIIMDEPTTALDVVVQRDILAKIMTLQKEFHFSIIFITHDLSLLLELANTVAIMYAGKMVEIASRQDLLASPRHPYSYGLLHSFPSLDGPLDDLKGIPGSPPDLRTLPPGCAFHPRCPFAFRACQRVVPPLYRLSATQRAACLLYDRKIHPQPPPKHFERQPVGTQTASVQTQASEKEEQ